MREENQIREKGGGIESKFTEEYTPLTRRLLDTCKSSKHKWIVYKTLLHKTHVHVNQVNVKD